MGAKLTMRWERLGMAGWILRFFKPLMREFLPAETHPTNQDLVRCISGSSKKLMQIIGRKEI
jgi:hypothetical protein